jgi:hypothetical protein
MCPQRSVFEKAGLAASIAAAFLTITVLYWSYRKDKEIVDTEDASGMPVWMQKQYSQTDKSARMCM